jgi:uncharacterized protein GlcG (DUF336 family)
MKPEQKTLDTLAALLAGVKWKLPPSLGEMSTFLQKELTGVRREAAGGDAFLTEAKLYALQHSARQIAQAAFSPDRLEATPEAVAALRCTAVAARKAAEVSGNLLRKDWLLALHATLRAMVRTCYTPKVSRDCITSAQAQAVCDGVLACARIQGLRLVAAVCDNGGNLLNLRRADDAFIASVDIAINKAYTSVALKMPTKMLATLAAPGGSLYGIQHTNNGRIVIFGGGVPLEKDGRIVGGFGVSGGSAQEDSDMADFAESLWLAVCDEEEATV